MDNTNKIGTFKGTYKRRKCQLCGASIESRFDGRTLKLQIGGCGNHKLAHPSIRLCEDCGERVWERLDSMVKAARR